MCRTIEHQVRSHITKLLTVLTTALQQFHALLVRFVCLLTRIGYTRHLRTVEPGEISLHLLIPLCRTLGDNLRSLLHQTLRLGEGTLSKIVVIALKHTTGSSEHRGSTEIELRTACGEGPHIVRRTRALAIGTNLIGFQRRVIVQTVSNRGGIAKMVVVVEDGIRECRGHVSNLLCLCHEVQRAMLDELQDIGRTVRTMQIDVTLFLANEGLVALRLEEFPCADEILHYVDV